MTHPTESPEERERKRYEILARVEDFLDGPVLLLGFAWLVLLGIELIWGLTPLLNAVVYIIWAIFIVDFSVRLILAPHKWEYLRRNWLIGLSLLAPALRVLRFARIAQSARLVNLLGSVNRGMRGMRETLRRRGFIYVILLTLVINLVGAAGIYAFENPQQVGAGGIESYPEALWLTSRTMMTMDSDYLPMTTEGRVLSLLVALYGFAMFGYITATLATFFLGQEAVDLDDDGLPDQPVLQSAAPPLTEPEPRPRKEEGSFASAASMRALRDEVRAMRRESQGLREEIAALRETLRKENG
jgi:voltage-gated potassium channel